MSESASLSNTEYLIKIGELIQGAKRQLKRDFDNEAVSYQTLMEKLCELIQLENYTMGLINEAAAAK